MIENRRITMHRQFIYLLLFVCLLQMNQFANAEKFWGDKYFSIGVFSYEEGDYEEALNLFKKAHQLNPFDPEFNHYLAKTYMELKAYDNAEYFFNRTLEINPRQINLKKDIALLHYKRNNYSQAEGLFLEILEESPSNVITQYHIARCLFKQKKFRRALKFFNQANQTESSIKTNCSFYSGIIYHKIGEPDEAAKCFEYVKTHTNDEFYRQEAYKWLRIIEKDKSELPYKFFLKLSALHDDNVGLLYMDNKEYFFLDEKQFSHQSGNLTEILMSFRYALVKQPIYQFQAGYNHFQRWHFAEKLRDFDLSGSIIHLSSSFKFYPFTFNLNYFPTFYKRNNEKYLDRQEFNPQILWEVAEQTILKINYRHDIDRYQDLNNKNGTFNAYNLALYRSFKRNKGYIYLGSSFERNSASHSDYSYDQLKINSGISWNLKKKIKLDLILKYISRNYDEKDSYHAILRKENKYYVNALISKIFFYDWLYAQMGYQYVKNDANIKIYKYDKNVISLSIMIKK